jgi:hypothetical protein
MVKRSARKAKRIDWHARYLGEFKCVEEAYKQRDEAIERGQKRLAEIFKLEKEIEKLRTERFHFCDFMHDVEVILAHHSADAICGSKWIPAQALLNARKRYAERTSA